MTRSAPRTRRTAGVGRNPRNTIVAICAMCFFLALTLVVVLRTLGLAKTLSLATLIGAVVGVVGFILSIVQLFNELSVRAEDIDDSTQISRAMTKLAGLVKEQWATEAKTRGLLQREPIDVQYETTERPVSAPAEAIIGRLSGSRPIRLRLHGELRQSVAKFRKLPRQQLVVLGEPGSGKTVFSLFFTLGLIDQRADHDRVPVLLPLTSWNPSIDRLHDWIARRIDEDYPELRWIQLRKGQVAQRLVAGGLILPILDGLDEIPGDLLGTAIKGISDSVASFPVVVTCRTDEYVAAVQAGGVLARAAVVELQPVAFREAVRYVSADVVGGAEKWRSVGQAIRDGGFDQVAKALSTPLMIGLADTAYRSPSADPAELLDRHRFPDQASIETYLLRQYIPAVFDPGYLGDGARTPSLADALRWLTFLAKYLRQNNTRDLAWWQLHSVLSRRAIQTIFILFVWVTGVLVACLVFGPLIGHSFFSAIGLIAGTACGLTAVVAARYGTVPGPPVRLLIAKGRRTRMNEMVRSAIVGGLAPGLIVAGAVTLTTNAFLGAVLGVLVFGLIGMVAGILRWSAPAEKALAASPRAVLRADRRATIFLGAIGSVLAASFVFATYASKYGYAQAAAAAVMGGLVLGFGFMLGTAWAWYHLTKAVIAMKRLLPWRFMAFLDQAHKRNVLRVAGGVYQFRHARLQDYLYDPAPDQSPSDASLGPDDAEIETASGGGQAQLSDA